MTHFDLSQWSDFARDLLGEAERRPMQEHLASGCDRCCETFDLLQRVAAAGRFDAHSPVPAELVRNAKAVFERQRPEHGLALPRLMARLVFDSFRSPAPAGVRSSLAAVRQTLYRAGDYRIDLRLEADPGQRQWSLVGQIANESRPDRRIADVPVFLMAHSRVLAFTRSNDFGEFQMDYRYAQKLRLSLPVAAAGRRIELALNPLLDYPDNPVTGGLV